MDYENRSRQTLNVNKFVCDTKYYLPKKSIVYYPIAVDIIWRIYALKCLKTTWAYIFPNISNNVEIHTFTWGEGAFHLVVGRYLWDKEVAKQD